MISASRPTRTRHTVLWLTVAAYMITYMDRVVTSSAAPFMRKELGLDIATMGLVLSAFRWGYSFFQIPGGWLGDVYGPRRALTAIVTWWSAFTCLTPLMPGPASLATCRFLFGMGEAGAFPIATRSLSRWMLPGERGYAQGLTHAGSRLGAALTPNIVIALIISHGWRMPFYIFGALGIVWAAIWYWWYRDSPEQHASVNEAERALIQGSLGERKVAQGKSIPWGMILRSKSVRTLSMMYFCYAWCIAVYLDWLPFYLKEGRGVDIARLGLYASLPLFAGTAGDLAGGWLSDIWVKRSGNINLGRRAIAIFGFLLAALGMLPATLHPDPRWCVLYTCIAVFGLELTVGVSWAIPLDVGGDFAGSVSAVMNTCGNMGGALSTMLVGYIVAGYGWNVPFYFAAAFCVAGALLYLGIDASRNVTVSGGAMEESPR